MKPGAPIAFAGPRVVKIPLERIYQMGSKKQIPYWKRGF